MDELIYAAAEYRDVQGTLPDRLLKAALALPAWILDRPVVVEPVPQPSWTLVDLPKADGSQGGIISYPKVPGVGTLERPCGKCGRLMYGYQPTCYCCEATP